MSQGRLGTGAVAARLGLEVPAQQGFAGRQDWSLTIMIIRPLAPIALALAAFSLAACGHNTEQRAATGAAAGAVVAGPVGAVVGAGAGVVADRVDRAN